MEETRSVLKVHGGEDIPYVIFKGDSGPTCFISGGMHGNEINGIHLVHLAMARLRKKKISGTIIFIPILNIQGFREGSRNVPKDDLDLNRCFDVPGRSLSHRIARTFLEKVVKKSDFGIDCHDSGANPVLIPHSRVHTDKRKACIDGCTLDFGKVFGSRIILERAGKKGMLAIASFHSLQIPVLTIEAGGGGVLWHGYLEQALQGIQNILISKGMIKGEIMGEDEQFLLEDIHRFGYASKSQGILYKNIKLGDHVHRGDTLAKVFDPISGKGMTVKAGHCGFVFSLRLQDKVEKEETICSILADRACRIHHTEVDKEGVIRVSE